jgi:hypothetical protein
MRKFLLLVTALAITIGATAQEKPFTYGLKVGLNLSQTSSGTLPLPPYDVMFFERDIDATDIVYGFFVSGHFNYSLSQFFGIQPELSFSMQGGNRTSNYINIPALFEVKPITNFSLFVGPQIGFNVYSSLGNINTFDFAAVVGLQYAIAGKYLISARYNIGLTPVYDIDGISGFANRVLQFGIGYQF